MNKKRINNAERVANRGVEVSEWVTNCGGMKFIYGKLVILFCSWRINASLIDISITKPFLEI